MATNGKKQLPLGKRKIGKLKNKFSWKNLILYGFLLLFSFFVMSALSGSYDEKKVVPISTIVVEVKKGNISEITVTADKLLVTKKNGEKVEAVKESGSDVYTLFKNAGVSLGDARVTVKDETGLS